MEQIARTNPKSQEVRSLTHADLTILAGGQRRLLDKRERRGLVDPRSYTNLRRADRELNANLQRFGQEAT